MGVGKTNALFGQRIDVRRTVFFASIAAEALVADVVCHDQQHIKWAIFGSCVRCCHAPCQEQQIDANHDRSVHRNFRFAYDSHRRNCAVLRGFWGRGFGGVGKAMLHFEIKVTPRCLPLAQWVNGSLRLAVVVE